MGGNLINIKAQVCLSLCEHAVMSLKIQCHNRLVAYAFDARSSYVGMSGYKERPYITTFV